MLSVTDAHLHVVSKDTDRFPLLLRGVGRDWWTGRAVDAEQIARDLAESGVERGVVVQAVGPYYNDNRYARDAVAQSGGRFALVAAIDTEGDNPAAEIAALADGGDIAGIRVAAFTGDAPWLTDGRGTAIWEAVAAAGANVVVACPADKLAAVADLARARPDVPVALDHCAFPDLGGGPPYRGAAPLFALASVSSIHPKVTTINLRAAAAVGGARAFVAQLIDAFGASRVCWGSDHPQSYEVPYPEMVDLALHATEELGASAREAVLNLTARTLWFAGT